MHDLLASVNWPLFFVGLANGLGALYAKLRQRNGRDR